MATIEINEIKGIILGGNPERNAKNINRYFNFANTEIFAELFRDQGASTIEVDSVKYSSDKKTCVIVKNGKEYLISEGQMAVKKPGNPATKPWNDNGRIKHTTVTDEGYISYEIKRIHDTLCEGHITIYTGDQTTDHGRVYLPFSGEISSQDWWSAGLKFSPDSSIDGFIQFLGSDKGFLQEENRTIIDIHNMSIYYYPKDKPGTSYSFTTDSDKIVCDSGISSKGYDYLNYPKFWAMLNLIKIIDHKSYEKFIDHINSIKTNNKEGNKPLLGDNLEELMADNNVKGPNKTL